MAGDEVAVDVERKQVIDNSSKPLGRLGSLVEDLGVVIPRVEEEFRRGSKHYYTPKIVSIGPYHHGNSHLRAMEEFKEQCLHDLLLRNETPYEGCIQAVGEQAALARKRYQGKIRPCNDDGFVAMMVRDAGFIIELFMKESEEENRCKSFWIYPLIKRDMLLLENQLPFFVLLRLFDLTIGQKGTDDSLGKLAINFCHSLVKKIATPELPLSSVHHLLHLYHSLYQSQCQPQFCPDRCERVAPVISLIPCATILHVMGGEFSKASEDILLTDVKFSSEGHTKELKVPRLFIAEETAVLFFNLIALEQHNISLGTHFTSYAVFMNYMLSKPDDEEFLCEKEIIGHRLGNHEEVVRLFATLCSRTFIGPHRTSLSALLSDLKNYSKSSAAIQKRRWAQAWWRNLYKDRVTFVISLFGGPGTWILSLLQTFFTIKQYR